MTVKDVKAMLRCSVALAYKLADDGRIPSIRIDCPGVGRQKKRLLRFKREDVIRFIESHYKR
jgi:hypothetical protein